MPAAGAGSKRAADNVDLQRRKRSAADLRRGPGSCAAGPGPQRAGGAAELWRDRVQPGSGTRGCSGRRHVEDRRRGGAIEIKVSWCIIRDRDEARCFHLRALIDVEGRYVADGNPPCTTDTRGLTGLHSIQNGGTDGSPHPAFIRASFEHVGAAPLAAAARDPTDPSCCKGIVRNAPPTRAAASRGKAAGCAGPGPRAARRSAG
jgi:hypothetical protein